MIEMQNWRTVGPEVRRKKAMFAQKMAQLRAQHLAEQQANARFYGDNL